MVHMDITDIRFPDESFDVIYASHVLEHVDDDRRAIRELHRVLRTGGWAVLPVPIHGKETREDPSVTDPEERQRLFGQSDHVRKYGRDGEYERRLRGSGFDVTVEGFVRELGPESVRRYRLDPADDIYVCTKPGTPISRGLVARTWRAMDYRVRVAPAQIRRMLRRFRRRHKSHCSLTGSQP